MTERLDAFLARRGYGSRADVRRLIRSGAVTLDGSVCRDAARHVEEGAEVRVRGEPAGARDVAATLILHKPVGYACSHDPREAPLLDELVPERFRHLPLQTAGRLDRDTSGLLVLSTDGALIHALTSPRRKLEKRYRIAYRGRLPDDAAARLCEGILLRGEERPTLPARLELEGATPDGLGRASLWLTEGRYHQVRRMMAALGAEVVRLHRDRVGGLELPADLPAGAARPLADDERRRLLGPGAER